MTAAKENPLKVVDVANLDAKTADQILEGFATQGFLFVDGHDFTQEEVDHFFELSKQYFALPQEVKDKQAIDADNCGYTSFHQEKLDPKLQLRGDPKEAFNFGLFNFITGDCKKEQLPELFAYGSENYKFINKMSKKYFELGSRILNLLAIGLKIDENEGGVNWFSDRHRTEGTSMTTMRVLHYPPSSKLDGDQVIRAGAHTDYGAITLLFQQKGQEGLELFDTTENWKPIPYVESANAEYRAQGKAAPIVVNIADQLSFWTNKVLKSTPHRVLVPNDVDRYSIVFFFHADNDVRLTPIPSPIVKAAAQPGQYDNKKPEDYITSKEYLLKRLKDTYA
ncbi:hypothetical protein WICMUC_004790 [Wickerhamomyces mucosus]|uniref:Fe2OG dioxygenase domain-containing protein n=1 Tax=Wickerhamomyces mucosus TaxID=1378264 RepID=A0A9P8TA78_9ASCO|nr:hypothetical protein WICMUC_004790 [Wickerhamomyces mucosus]